MSFRMFPFIVLLFTVIFAATSHAENWDARYIDACKRLPNPEGVEVNPVRQGDICRCVFFSVAHNPLWGEVQGPDLKGGLSILDRTSAPAASLGKTQPAVKPLHNKNFEAVIASLTHDGVATLTRDPTINSCLNGDTSVQQSEGGKTFAH